MPIALSEDQKSLAESVTAVTARHASKTATRAEFEDLAAGIWPLSWRALVDQRLLGLHLPEEAGGDGAGLVELAIMLEETAFGLLPGPLLPTVLTSLLVSRHGGAELRDRLLPAFVAGGTGACATEAGGLTATRTPDGWEVSGTTVPVLGAVSAETYILGAQSADGAGETIWFVVAGEQRAALTVTRLQSVDLTRDIGRLTLSGLPVPAGRLLGLDSAPAPRDGRRAVQRRGGWRSPLVPDERACLHEGARAVRADHRELPGDQAQVRAAVRPQRDDRRGRLGRRRGLQPGRGPVRPRRRLRGGDLPARRGGHRPGDGHAVRRHRLHVGARHPPVLAPRDEPGQPAGPARPLGAGTGRDRAQDRTPPRPAAGRRARRPAHLGRRPAGRGGGAARGPAAGLPRRAGPGLAALPAPLRDRGRPGGTGRDLAGVRARRE